LRLGDEQIGYLKNVIKQVQSHKFESRPLRYTDIASAFQDLRMVVHTEAQSDIGRDISDMGNNDD